MNDDAQLRPCHSEKQMTATLAALKFPLMEAERHAED